LVIDFSPHERCTYPPAFPFEFYTTFDDLAKLFADTLSNSKACSNF
jgi:hypothetical protein